MKRIVLNGFGIGEDMEHIKGRSGKVLVYISNRDSNVFSISDTLLIKGKLDIIRKNTNPNSFDYAKFLSKKGIKHQCFSKEVLRIGPTNKVITTGFIRNLQENCKRLMNTYLTDSATIGIVSAMVLGNRAFLSDDVNRSFVETGAIHTLAVSGLHVGIIASLIMMLLRFFPTNQQSVRFLYFLLSASSIWIFAFLAGGRPSVIRASLMFTLFIFDFYMSGQPNSFNFLAFSAMAMLAIDPNALFDVGFQFSFLALLGILTLYKPIKGLLPVGKIKVLQYAWNLMSVSIAAQLAVAPLSIYYFHQFPTYFWLSSLWAIPWTYIIVMTGMLFLVGGMHSEILARFFSGILDVGVEILMKGIVFMQGLPYGHLKDLWFTEEVVGLIYLSLLLMTIYIYFKKQWAFYWLLAFVTIVGFMTGFRNVLQERQNGLTVYDLNKGSLVDVFDGKKLFVLKDTQIDEQQENFVASGNRQYRGVREVQTISEDTIIMEHNVYIRDDVVIASNKVIYIPDNQLTSYQSKIDYLILTAKCAIDIETILNKFKPELVILDRSLPSKKAWIFSQKLEEQGIELHDVRQAGSFNTTW